MTLFKISGIEDHVDNIYTMAPLHEIYHLKVITHVSGTHAVIIPGCFTAIKQRYKIIALKRDASCRHCVGRLLILLDCRLSMPFKLFICNKDWINSSL